jgi:NAD-dependent dihydropyrimidine dehydrogenase PreA subunit
LESKNFFKVSNQKSKNLKYFYYAKFIKEVDVVINLPKLKTHMQTFFTGCIKNMFGGVPVKERRRVHLIGGYKKLSEALVEIYSKVKPNLNIMDGIIGMEGNGPSQGKPKKVGVMLVSDDGVALDTVATYITGYKIHSVHTNYYGWKIGLGCADIEKINILGNGNLDDFMVSFKKPSTLLLAISNIPIVDIIGNFAEVKAYIDPEKCTKCGVCQESCPVGCIQYEKIPFIDNKKCIQCFCCHELCPNQVVEVKRNLLAKILSSVEST